MKESYSLMSLVNSVSKFGRGFKSSLNLLLFSPHHKWQDFPSNGVKMFLTLMIYVFLITSCLSLQRHSNPKTPQEIVRIFMSTYGTPRISQLADHTTPYFRNYKPEELWVIETWEILSELGYRHVTGKILEENIKDNTAIIITLSNIETIAGETLQKEIYCFIKTSEGWKLDELLIEEETIETRKYNL
jgi:hypothetical protein